MIKLVESLLSMLDKDVPDNCKTCSQFFHLLSAYANMVLGSYVELLIMNNKSLNFFL